MYMNAGRAPKSPDPLALASAHSILQEASKARVSTSLASPHSTSTALRMVPHAAASSAGMSASRHETAKTSVLSPTVVVVVEPVLALALQSVLAV